ncbi:MAG: GNAT family N-acetyltransferase [Anaerolineae bacterium]|nr:GNAT family N-acetyltransferase [Anaerolineae bacterium]
MAKIRRMQEGDAEAVRALWDANCLEAAGRPLSGTESARVLALLRAYPSHPATLAYVAESEGAIVGFVTAYLSRHPVQGGSVGEIEELYVKPEARRMGIGTALVAEAAGELQRRGADLMRTRVCVESVVARALWQALGWELNAAEYACFAAPGGA